ncbi:unnamed protein product, partial [marine sediment metagenome]
GLNSPFGLVRPVVTFLVMLALVGILVYLVVIFGSEEMAKDIVAAFLILVAAISGFWFGSRAPTPPK